MFITWTRIFIFIILLQFSCVQCGKILGVFPVFGLSHHKLSVALMRGLAEFGHDVTIVGAYEDKYTPKNGSYRSIILDGFAENFKDDLKNLNLFEIQDFNQLFQEVTFEDYMYPITDKIFSDPGIQNLIESKETFDAVIVEQFSNDALKVLAYLFNSHLIVYNSFGPFNFVNRLVGNPNLVSYTPQLVSSFPRPMSFLDRLHNTILFMVEEFMNQYVFLPQQDKLIKKHFPDAPSIFELVNNVSLVLVNSHESMWQSIPLVPNLVNIGGFHITPPKKLPQDIQEFLDNAEDGVIYFSLGSNLKGTELPKEKMEIFLNSFKYLKQKVLWKLEGDVPGLPNNVKTKKWLPQVDVLAHPNVQMFITHGGLLSMTETIYNGVPVLVIPVFGDQANNARNSVYAGFGLSILYHDPNFTKQKFNESLTEILNNPKFKQNAVKQSKIFHDRPMKPLEAATYWVNYIIQHEGAKHLRVDGLNMYWYQYLLLDVILVLVVGVLIVLFVLSLIIKLLFRVGNSKKIKKS